VPHPGALRLLARRGIDPAAFRSKSWNEFAGADGPRIDIAITVCGNAAQEACPVFMGAPVKGHWGLPDPADATGTDAEVDAAFEATWQALERRVEALLATRFEDMPPRELAEVLTRIGRMDGAA
jgi:arsenate reductase